MNTLKLCLLVTLILELKAGTDFKIDKKNIKFNPRAFLKEFNWFDLKEFYNQANQRKEKENIKISKSYLNQLKSFRLRYIKKFLKEAANDNCLWVKRIPTKYQQKFQNILKLFEGNTLFMYCDHFVYVFNYFGSDTPTSDLDFGMYRINKKKPSLDYLDELENIKTVNEIIQNAIGRFLAHVDKNDYPMQRLLDMNGYPDMFVIYDRYFRYYDSLEIVNNGSSNLMNIFSSPLLRVCFTSNIYIYMSYMKSSHQDPVIPEMMNSMLFTCLKKMLSFMAVNMEEIQEKLLQGRRLTKELNPRQDKVVGQVYPNHNINFEYLKSEEYIRKLMLSFQNMFEMYTINKYKNPNSFSDCIDNIKDLDFFMKFLDVGEGTEQSKRIALMSLSNPNRVQMRSENSTFNIYSQIFYVENNDIDIKNSIDHIGINRLYMTFLASCFTFADEAYSTIGPLEYVKFKSKIESGETGISCLPLIENIGANFNMILIHISEDESIENDLANTHQSISDALSKYLIRAMSNLHTPCFNIYGQKINSLINNYEALNIYLNEYKIHQFYNDILEVNPKDDDKKDQYFEKYNVMVGMKTVREIYVDVLKTYLTVYRMVLNSLNEYIFAPIDQDYYLYSPKVKHFI